MTVYLFSHSYEIGQIIADHLITHDYNCFLFKTKDDLYTEIYTHKKFPDLIVLDYLTFNHDFFNLHTYLIKNKISQPLIFFNDPCIIGKSRTRHWLYQLDILTYRESDQHLSKEERASYEALFSTIEEIVELDELAPYIILMQKPKPLPKKLIKQTMTIDYIKANCTTENDIPNIKLPGNLSFLLNIFTQNSDTPLKIEDILFFYKKEGKQMTENSLKVLISNLRKEIRNNKDCNFIISNNKGVYALTRLREP